MATTTTGDTINANGNVGIIDFSGLSYVPGAYATYSTSTDVLAVYSGNYYASVTVNNPGTTTFAAQPDGKGGTEAVPLCFATGTLIRTTAGDCPVESLQVGDLAVTASGTVRPIRWIGHRVLRCAEASVPSETWPVRIRAGAFGTELPMRDLYLSPGHPVLVDGDAGEVLVPVMCLINGTSIARSPRDEITYWHIELDAHDILLADGLPAESFHDGGSRSWFGASAANVSADLLANPDLIPTGTSARCRPVLIDGPVLEAERRRLDGLFAMALAAVAVWPVVQSVDQSL